MVIAVVEVHIKEGVELKPRHPSVVAASLQSVANAHSPHRPIIDRVDGRKLREVNRAELGRRLIAIEPQNCRRISSVLIHVRKVRERLNNVHESIQPKRAALNILPSTRDLERSFCAGVKNREKCVSIELNWVSQSWRR